MGTKVNSALRRDALMPVSYTHLEEEFIDNFEQIAKAYVATALAVTGIVTLTPNAKQPFEIKARKVEIEAASTPDYPLQPKSCLLYTSRCV